MPMAGGGSENAMVISPVMTAVLKSALLLYGICWKRVPVRRLNSSLVSWKVAAVEP